MSKKGRQYKRKFKVETVRLVTEDGSPMIEAARGLGLNQSVLQHWKKQFTADSANYFPGQGHLKPEAEVEVTLD